MVSKAGFVKGALELTTGYSSQIKAADDFNDKVGGTDGLVGRGVTSLAQGLIYVPLTKAAADLTSNAYASAKSAAAAGNSWEAFGNGFVTAVGGIATAHMGSRVLAAGITLVPNAREKMEEAGII